MSIPALLSDESLLLSSPKAFRMAHILVAILADAAKVALALAIVVDVVNVQRKVRIFLHVLLMVHQLSPAKSATLFADLAFIPVKLPHLRRFCNPLSTDIERMHISGSYQPLQPFQKALCHYLALNAKSPPNPRERNELAELVGRSAPQRNS